jgi:hypothetical protein
MTARVVVGQRVNGTTDFGAACYACELDPMMGLTYDGAVNLVETHNREHGHDNRIPVDLRGVDHSDRAAVLRRCRLELMAAGGLDGDWIEIESELETRDMWDVLADYFEPIEEVN